jgi:hypothetical protein
MNYTAEDLNREVTEYLYFNTGLLSFYLFLGLTGNSCVLFIYTRKMKMTEERYFIPMLAISDIFACLAGIILGIVSNFNRANYQLDTFCKVGYFFTWTTTAISGFLILLIALSRHLKICRPTSPQLTVVRKRRALIVMASIAFVMSLPMLYFFGGKKVPYVYKGQSINVTLCTLRFNDGMMNVLQYSYFGFEVFLALLNMIVTCGLYIPVGLEIYFRFRIIQQNVNQRTNSKVVSTVSGSAAIPPIHRRVYINEPEKKLSVVSNSSVNLSENEIPTKCETDARSSVDARKAKLSSLNRRKNTRRKQVRNNFTMMFAMIIIIYVLAYVPTLLLVLLPGTNPAEFWFSRSAIELNVLVFFQRAFLLNNILNPFIYTYFDLSFRSELINMVMCCRKNQLSSTL